MKSASVLAFLLAPLALAKAVPKDRAISYDGWKAVRIATHNDAAAIKRKLAGFDTRAFNFDNGEKLDVAIAPEDIDKFEALGLDVTQILHEDLGADIATEGELGSYEGERALVC